MIVRFLCVIVLALAASVQPAKAGVVQFIHVAPYDANVADTEIRLRINRLWLNETIRYGEISAPRYAPNATLELTFVDINTGQWLVSGSHSFDTGYAWVFLMGDGVNEDFRIKVVNENVSPGDNEGLPLRFLHASPATSLQPVAWRNADGTLVAGGQIGSGRPLNDLRFGSITEFALPAGEYDTQFTTPAGDQTLVEALPLRIDDIPDALPGQFRHLALIGDGAHQPFELLSIPGDTIETVDAIDNSTLGWWHATNTPASEGLLIQPLPDEDRMVGTIYTYAEDGSGFPAWFTFDTCDSEPGQVDCAQPGGFTGRSALAGVYASSGGQLGGDQTSTTERVGTLLLDFVDCDRGDAFLLLDNGTEVSWEIERLTRTVACNWDADFTD